MKKIIQQIQNQINTSGRKIGKISNSLIYSRDKTKIVNRISENSDGKVKWRRISFNRSSLGLFYAPRTTIRDYLINYVSDREGEISDSWDFPNDVTVPFQTREVIVDSSILHETNITKGETVIYFTSVYSTTPVNLPMKIDVGTSLKIEKIYRDGSEVIIESIINSGDFANSSNFAGVFIPANTYVTIMIYTYNGSSNSEFTIDTKILENTFSNLSPAPFDPEQVKGTKAKSDGIITLSWAFEPFLIQSDSIEIWRGFKNDEIGEYKDFRHINTIPGYSVRYDDRVAAGATYYYKIRFKTSDGSYSDFSDEFIGSTLAPPAKISIELFQNPATNEIGYYKNFVEFNIVSDRQLDKSPIVQHIDPTGKIFITSKLVPKDETRLIWYGKQTFIKYSPKITSDQDYWTEGKVTMRAYTSQIVAQGTMSESKDDDTQLGANTSVGNAIAETTYILDMTPPTLSSIHISVEDDRIEADDNFANKTNVFIVPDEENSKDPDTNAYPQDVGSLIDAVGKKYVSGIHSIQFANTNSSLSDFSDWTLWEKNKNYGWVLKGTHGTNNVYAKIRDRAGNISNVISDDIYFVLNDPEIVNILYVSGMEYKNIVAWTPASGQEIVGYVIYRDIDPNIPGALDEYERITGRLVSSYADANVVTGVTYNYKVKAYNVFGKVSTSFSSQLSGIPIAPTIGISGDTIPPSATVWDTIETDTVNANLPFAYSKLRWIRNSESDLNGYHLYRKEYVASSYEPIKFVADSGSNPIDTYRELIDAPLVPGRDYYYGIAAVDDSGNFAPITEYPSNPITAGDTTSPGTITGLYVNDSLTPNATTITFNENQFNTKFRWTNPSDIDFAFTRILIYDQSVTPTAAWANAYKYADIPGIPGEESSLAIPVDSGTNTLFVFFDPYDRSGNSYSETVSIPYRTKLIFTYNPQRRHTHWYTNPAPNALGWHNTVLDLHWTKDNETAQTITDYIYTSGNGPRLSDANGILGISNDTTATGLIYNLSLLFDDNVESEPVSVLLKVDRTPPTTPVITGSNIVGGIQLNWTEGVDSGSGLYQTKLFRKTDNVDPTDNDIIARLNAGVSGYTDNNIDPGITYYYSMRQLDAAGNFSNLSNKVSVRNTANQMFGSINFFENSSFEDFTADKSEFVRWTRGASDILATGGYSNTTDKYHGLRSVVASTGNIYIEQQGKNIFPSSYYGISLYGRTGGASRRAEVKVFFKDISGATIASGFAQTDILGLSFTRYSTDNAANYITIGPNGSSALFQYDPVETKSADIRFAGPNGGIEVDAVMLEEIYYDGANWKNIFTDSLFPSPYYESNTLQVDAVVAYLGRFFEIYANNIIAGRLQSFDNRTYFDLDNSKIVLQHSGEKFYTEMDATRITKTLTSGLSFMNYISATGIKIPTSSLRRDAFTPYGEFDAGDIIYFSGHMPLLSGTTYNWQNTYNILGSYLIIQNLVGSGGVYGRRQIARFSNQEEWWGTPQVSGYFDNNWLMTVSGQCTLYSIITDIAGIAHENLIVTGYLRAPYNMPSSNPFKFSTIYILVGNNEFTFYD